MFSKYFFDLLRLYNQDPDREVKVVLPLSDHHLLV
jgi:hypothetical protein